MFVRCLKLHTKCWPGLRRKHVFGRTAKGELRILTFVKMWFPAALAIASDFWRVSAIGIAAFSISSDALGVFNACYRILWMALTLVGSISYATSIMLGQIMGRGDVPQSRLVVMVGMSLALGVALVLGGVVATMPRQLGNIFSKDTAMLDKFEEIRIPLAVVTTLMNFSVALERVPVTMGRTRVVLFFGLVGSWVGQVGGWCSFMRGWLIKYWHWHTQLVQKVLGGGRGREGCVMY